MADRTRPRRTPPKRKAPRRKEDAVKRHPASRTPARRRPPSPRVRRRRLALSTVLLGLAVVGFLFAFVYPTSTYLQQRSELSTGEERIARVAAETKRLEEQNRQLLTDEEVERLAREQYGLVRPGETPFVLVPAAPSTTTTAPAPEGATTPQP